MFHSGNNKRIAKVYDRRCQEGLARFGESWWPGKILQTGFVAFICVLRNLYVKLSCAEKVRL